MSKSNSKLKYNFVRAILALGLLSSAFLAGSQPARAQSRSYSIDNLDVQIVVNKDSTVTVEETFDYTFVYGKFNGMFREITTNNRKNDAACANNPALQCGGFDFISIDRVKVDGKEVADDRYQTSTVTSGAEDRMRVQYRFADEAVSLTNEKHRFSVRYTLLGSLGFFDDYALLYWNAIFPDRDVTIKNAAVQITYPGPVSTDTASSKVITSAFDYTGPTTTGNTVAYRTSSVLAGVDFTILQKIPLNLVEQPGSLNLQLSPADQLLGYKDIKLDLAGTAPIVKSLPSGTYPLTFSKDGYYSQVKQVQIDSGKTTELSVELVETPFHRFLALLVIGINLCCCLLAVFSPIVLWLIWYSRGRDAGRTDKVIAPEYSPPAGMKPYLLGTLKDEKADLVDITASIIDLAYLGYLKIVELPGSGLFSHKDFQLERSSKPDDVEPFEKNLLSSIFKSSETVKISDLKYKFYTSLPVLKSLIYKKLMTEGYFKQNPESTRNGWMGLGIAVLVLGGTAGFFAFGIGLFSVFCASTAIGVGIIVLSRFMPAKTASGTEALRLVKGFRMYLETAEKYTLQKLTPDRFEAYLSYAMVFGIERTWAEKFKDIYTTAPDWYVGSNYNTFNSLILADSLRGFSRQTTSTISTAPSSKSSSGGGWSGGGGFSGGFSGGGGGGGGGGAW